MPCHRCHSLMFPVDLLDEAGGILHQRTAAWRCFACGDIIDPVICEHRDRAHDCPPEQRDMPRARIPLEAAH